MLKRVCNFYNTSGKCRFGKHCRFSHVIEGTESPDFRSDRNDESISAVQGKEEEFSVTTPELNQDQTPENEGLNGKNTSVDCKVTETKICRFYASKRFCSYGKKCKFLHVRRGAQAADEPKHQPQDDVNLKDEAAQDSVQDEESAPGSLIEPLKPQRAERKEKGAGRTNRRICRYFKSGECRFGKKCRYFHPPDTQNVETELEALAISSETQTKDGVESQERKIATRQPVVPKSLKVFKRDEITDGELKELRTTEIQQLKRRFPADALVVKEDTDELSTFCFSFSPSDPDWPYDVRTFEIEVSFAALYPLQLFEARLSEDQELPETVKRYVEVSIQEWLDKKEEESKKKGTVELLFRPFLRWFDRGLQEIVTEGLRQLRRELTAKAAGFEFVPAKPADKVPDQEPEGETTPDEPEPYVTIYRKADVEEVYSGPERMESCSDSEEEDSDEEDSEEEEEGEEEGKAKQADTTVRLKQMAIHTEHKGTEMALRSMDLYYFCATILLEKIHLSIQCSRCKNKTEFSTPPYRVNSIPCSKCSNEQLVQYRAVLIHSYCTTFGYLDLEGCAVVDVLLQNCVFCLTCATCNRDCYIKNFCPGKTSETICRECHRKIKFSGEAVKFSVLQPSGVELGKGKLHQVKTQRLRRIPKDPAIQEGRALPDNGSCKHYKKSFRWLRFPCCGKCYPCDICHDEKEMDHEMKYANRMICGFCCKEQIYSVEKPCVACSSSLTKTRSTHWEGGKGCRNKIAMSRSDNQKYKNLGKTTSNKSKLQKEKTMGKKNTRLRHT